MKKIKRNHKDRVLVISLGGSVIVPNEVDTIFLKKFRGLVLNFTKKGGRAVIVAGGGFTNKKYNQAVGEMRKATSRDMDWLGIAATKLNAELLRVIFGEAAHKKVIDNPTKKIKTAKKIIIGSGWLPGCSSDKDAVLWARNMGTKTVVNFSDIDYIYDKDPKKFKNAKPLRKLSWREYKKLIGNKWIPRMHAPFDPVAARLAERLDIKVVVINRDINNFKSFLSDHAFRGSELG